jgi:hypothetical protein
MFTRERLMELAGVKLPMTKNLSEASCGLTEESTESTSRFSFSEAWLEIFDLLLQKYPALLIKQGLDLYKKENPSFDRMSGESSTDFYHNFIEKFQPEHHS